MWLLTVNRSVGRVVRCTLCGLCLSSQRYCGSTVLRLYCEFVWGKGRGPINRPFWCTNNPSAKSSFCLSTDSAAISQSLLNPFLLAAVWQHSPSLLFTTCTTETARQRDREKRAFFSCVSYSLFLCIFILCWKHHWLWNSAGISRHPSLGDD